MKHIAVLAVIMAIFLLWMWGTIEGLKMLPEVFTERPTVTPTATATSTSTATPTATATATSTPTPTNTSTPVPTATPVSHRIRVTYYGEALRDRPLYCGSNIYGLFDPSDPTTAAMGANGPPCGSRLQLCSESACIVVVIKDKCPGCGPDHLDLSQAGWKALGWPSMVDMTTLERKTQ